MLFTLSFFLGKYFTSEGRGNFEIKILALRIASIAYDLLMERKLTTDEGQHSRGRFGQGWAADGIATLSTTLKDNVVPSVENG